MSPRPYLCTFCMPDASSRPQYAAVDLPAALQRVLSKKRAVGTTHTTHIETLSVWRARCNLGGRTAAVRRRDLRILRRYDHHSRRQRSEPHEICGLLDGYFIPLLSGHISAFLPVCGLCGITRKARQQRYSSSATTLYSSGVVLDYTSRVKDEHCRICLTQLCSKFHPLADRSLMCQ